MRLPDRGLRRAPGRAERPRPRQQTRPGQRQDGHPPVIRGHGSVVVITVIITIINRVRPFSSEVQCHVEMALFRSCDQNTKTWCNIWRRFFNEFSLEIAYTKYTIWCYHMSLFRWRLRLNPPSELAPGELQQVSLGPQLRPRQVSQLGEIREVMTRMMIGDDPDIVVNCHAFTETVTCREKKKSHHQPAIMWQITA